MYEEGEVSGLILYILPYALAHTPSSFTRVLESRFGMQVLIVWVVSDVAKF